MEIQRNRPQPPELSFPVNRIVLLVILLVTFGAGILILYRQGVESSEKATAADKAPREEDDFAPPLGDGAPITLAAELAAHIEEEGPGRSRIDEAPYRELMSQVYNRTSRFLRERLGYREADYDSLVGNPAAHRGQTLFVRGELVDFGERFLDRPIGEYNRVHFGVIRDNQGKLFWFETLSFDEEHILETGQIVIAEGVFFKIFKYIRVVGSAMLLKDLPEIVDDIPMLVCRSVRRSYTVREVTELDKELVRSAGWLEPGDQEKLEVRPFYHLLGYLKNLSPDRIEKKPAAYPDMAERLLRDALLDRFRGEWVHIWGRLGPIYKFQDDENPAGITHHYRAYLRSSDGVYVEVVLVEKPIGFKPYVDIVEVTGVFFKPRVWESDGGQTVRAPVIVAKSIHRKVFPPNLWAYVAVGLAVLLAMAVMLIFVIVYRERVAIRKHNEEFIRRRRERRLKAASGSTGSPGA
ncbi:MAG: hypothetical protein JXQ29_13540 [Planctomycetes bacterium]|nr:hypothetical protein [Planctomycetota bacterium]